MDNKILLIASKQSFMVNAITKSLVGAGYDVTYKAPVMPKGQSFSKDELPRIILFYLEEDVDEMSKALVLFKDIATEDDGETKLFLIGNTEEIESAGKILTDDVLTDTFLRPLNVKQLADRLTELSEMESAEANRKRNILVVDDDGTMLRTLKLWLSDRYRVYMANSGMNAITLLARNPVDLILLDYEMPVANGPQVLEMIRSEETTRHTPVMFLTAKNDKESVVSVMSLKPEKYLLKTMPPDQLLEAIEDFFASKEPTKASTYRPE
jgi:CheY-like chemotaxis protein